jgi:hypothetical protein
MGESYRHSARMSRSTPHPRRLHAKQHAGKKVHETKQDALPYMFGTLGPEDNAAYPCQWTDDWTQLRTGTLHWHVGRTSIQSAQHPAAPEYKESQ